MADNNIKVKEVQQPQQQAADVKVAAQQAQTAKAWTSRTITLDGKAIAAHVARASMGNSVVLYLSPGGDNGKGQTFKPTIHMRLFYQDQEGNLRPCGKGSVSPGFTLSAQMIEELPKLLDHYKQELLKLTNKQ